MIRISLTEDELAVVRDALEEYLGQLQITDYPEPGHAEIITSVTRLLDHLSLIGEE